MFIERKKCNYPKCNKMRQFIDTFCEACGFKFVQGAFLHKLVDEEAEKRSVVLEKRLDSMSSDKFFITKTGYRLPKTKSYGL